MAAVVGTMLAAPVSATTRGAASTAAAAHRRPPPVEVQILAVNDFHGHIASTRLWLGQNVGRADVLAAYVRQAEAEVSPLGDGLRR